MALAHTSIGTEKEEEWQELQAVLMSGILDRASNLRHFLEYIAEQHFAGKTEQIKEYSIAVQALHRQAQFDPQTDTIVRVSAHTLRKKLDQYYATEGADHLIQIRLPAGKYVLQFSRKEPAYIPAVNPGQVMSTLEEPLEVITRANRSPKTNLAFLGLTGVAALLLLLGNGFLKRERPGVAEKPASLMPVVGSPGAAGSELRWPEEDRAMHIRFGRPPTPMSMSPGKHGATTIIARED